MDHRDENKVEELFEIAVHLSSEEREAFFERHCRDEPEVRAELESLLQHDDEETKGFLVSPLGVAGDREATRSWPAGAPESTETVGNEGPELSPEHVGRYLVRRKIGEGGMGSVYLAEQRHPVRRDVAIKLIKAGMDSEEVLARFARERAALELMDHPGISRLLDGGTTEGGRPYFVMEYTPGLPIDRYCDEQGLGVSERLRLFWQVCDAVQYAHQKGVIHRDLKPSNVLVTEHERGPLVKVIDFGIAFAEAGANAGDERSTELRQVLGTRYYMSPEQASPEGADVDTRSDVYSLGVMLYDLLVGVLPFDSQTSPTVGEATPLPPSRRFSQLGQDSDRIARERGTSARAHVRRLSGDLDWITIKAMERDPARRYATASELGADIRRHLTHEPVLAGPPEWNYVLLKFLRRHRTIVIAASLALIALVIGTAGLAWGLMVAAEQRDEALESANQARDAKFQEAQGRIRAEAALSEAQAARAARERALAVAEQKSADAQAVTDFLVETVALADLEVTRSPDISLEGMLRRAGERVAEAFAGYPEGEVAVRGALGRAFHSMGRLEDAEEHLQRALDLEGGLLTTPPAEIFATMQRLSQIYGDSDSRTDFELRSRAHELALSLVESESAALGELLRDYHDESLHGEIWPTQAMLAELRLAASFELEEYSPLWLVLADCLEFLGMAMSGGGQESPAVQTLEEVLRIRREHLPSLHPGIARTHGLLVDLFIEHGRLRQAEELVRESIDIYVAALSPSHWLVAEARSRLGEALSYQGRGDEAESLLEAGHEAIVAARGLASRAGVGSAHRLVNHYTLYGDPDSADLYRAQLVQALAGSKNQPWRFGVENAAFGPEYSGLFFALHELDHLLSEAQHEERPVDPGRYQAALDAIRLEWEITTELESPLSLIVARWLVEYPFFPGQVDSDLIRELQGRMLEVLEPHQESFLRPVVLCWLDLHELAVIESDESEAEFCLRRALGAVRDQSQRPSELRFQVELELVDYLASRDRYAEAEETLLRTWEESVEFLGISHRSTLEAMSSLLQLYDRWGLPQRADSCLRRHLSDRTAADLDTGRLLDLCWFITRSEGFEPDLYELALSAARRVRELSPGEEPGRSAEGMALLRLGRLDEAERELEGCSGLIEARQLRHGVFRVLLRIARDRFEEAAELLENLDVPAKGTNSEARRVLLEARRRLEREY